MPESVPFDTSAGTASPALDAIVAGPAAALTAVAVVVGPRARASGWGAAAAVALARRWAGDRRVLLADLDLERPRLHELLGVRNDEGVVDVIEFGVSPEHVAIPVDDGRFDLLPAGAFATDAGAVLRHPAWARLLVETTRRRATLLACVPADAAGADAVIQRTGAVLVLAEAGEGDDVVSALARPYAALAVLTPPQNTQSPATSGAASSAAAAASPVLEPPAATPRRSDEEFARIRLPTDRAARDALILELRERQREARMAPPPLRPAESDSPADDALHVAVPGGAGDVARDMRVEAAADDVSLDDAQSAVDSAATDAPGSRDRRQSPEPLDTLDPGRPRPRRARLTHPLAWTLAVVLMASLIAGAWRYLAQRLGPAAGAATAADTSAALVPAPTPPTEVALPFVVALEAHRDVDTAVERVATLASAEPELRFHVAPLERDGTLFYHVMAGPLADSATAVAVRDSLIARGHKTLATPTDVRAAPLAFLVGEHGSRGDAVEQLDTLQRLNVPGYVLDVEAPDGDRRYRVWIGGFGTAAQADVVRQLLQSAGIRDSLVTRTGSITP